MPEQVLLNQNLASEEVTEIEKMALPPATNAWVGVHVPATTLFIWNEETREIRSMNANITERV